MIAPLPPGFAIRLLAAVAVVLALTAAINIAADPNRRWETGLGAPDPTDPRAAKLAVIDGARDVELLIAGDSRAQRLDPVYVSRRTRRRAFNGAVSGATSAVQHEAFRRVSRHNPGMQTMVILSGVEAFKRDEHTPSPDRSAERVFSAFQLERSFLGLLDTAGLLAVEPKFVYRRDGLELESSQSYVGQGDDLFRDGVPRLDVQWNPPRPRAGFADLARLLAGAHTAGVQTVLVLMPYHGRALARNRAIFRLMRRRVHRQLAAIAATTPFELVDFMEPTAAGVRPGGFSDPGHMDAENMRRLFDRILLAAPWLRSHGA